jgi:protein-tyrosine phosphatase
VALTALEEDGVRTVITTPHVDGSVTLDPLELEDRLEQLDVAWAVLTEHAAAHHAGLRLERGVELMLDTPDPDIRDPRLRLAGGPFILFEFPFLAVPPRSGDVIGALRRRDCLPIIAHPERYAGFAPDYSLAEQWKQAGGFLQVNGASLLGRYGPDARRFAYGLLQRGWADYLCSDYHARGQTCIRHYRELLEDLGAGELSILLTEVNPSRILSGQPPLPVPPLRFKRSLWRRVSELFQAG